LPANDQGQPPGQRFKFRRVHEITGTFVLIIIAVLIAALVWAGRSQRWFKGNVTLQTSCPKSARRESGRGPRFISWARSSAPSQTS
jgi:hypothetical protein